MPDLRSVRPLDAAIAVVAALVLVVAGYLGWSVWSHNRTVENATPIARAIAELETMIDKKPADVNLRMELAQAYTVAGRDDEASAQYQQILESKKDYLPALSGLGFVASRQREWERAEQYWKRVLKILEKQPNASSTKQYETAHFYLGNAYLEQKKYEDAVAHFKESLRVNRSASDSHYLLAVAYRGLGATEEYKQELEITLAFDPMMAEANYDYGRLLLDEGNIAAAAQHFRISADQAPDRAEPRDELERLGPFSKRVSAARGLRDSDPEKALVEARVAVALEPDDVGALVLLGGLYEATGDKESALDTFRRVVVLDPENKAAKAGVERLSDGK